MWCGTCVEKKRKKRKEEKRKILGGYPLKISHKIDFLQLKHDKVLKVTRMPADLSKKAMVIYIKNALAEFDHLRILDMRAEKIITLLTYILVYFKQFVANFKTNMDFLIVLRERCVYFVSNDQASPYKNLVHTASTLLDKINQAISDIKEKEKE